MESHADVDLKYDGNGNGDTHQVQTIYLGNFKFPAQLNRLHDGYEVDRLIVN